MTIIAIAVAATVIGTALYVDDGAVPTALVQPERAIAPATRESNNNGMPHDIVKREAATQGEESPLNHEGSLSEPHSESQRNVPQIAGKEKGGEDKQHREIKPVNITGVQLIELTRKELARIGIAVDSSSVWMINYEGKNATRAHRWSITTEGGMFPPSDKPIDKLQGVDTPHVSPVLITDDRGVKRAIINPKVEIDPEYDSIWAKIRDKSTSIEDRQRLIKMLSGRPSDRAYEDSIDRRLQAGKLVGILVRTGIVYTVQDSINRRWRPDYIIWFEATPELLSLLPERIRIQISAEVAQAESLRVRPEGLATARAAGVVTGEEHYLGILRSTSGAITSTTVYPNPARGKTVLRFTLSEPRTVRLTIHDINGRLLREVANEMQLPAGEHTDAMVDLSGLADGIYLVAITTDKGERGVQRVIVQK